MEPSTASVLITGGSSGIGLGLATRFLQAGSRVLITGRDAHKLAQAAQLQPGLLTYAGDVGQLAGREALARHARQVLPGLNVVLNNAGIQRRVGLAQDDAPWPERQQELDILLAAPVHLNSLLIPGLLQQGRPSLIVNVTSGGAYIPQAFAPLYSACKAALHRYTLTLRHALSGTLCRVVELVPPAVQTALAGPAHGAPLNAFCDAVFPAMLQDDATVVGYGPTANLSPELSGQPLDLLFAAAAARFPTRTYATAP